MAQLAGQATRSTNEPKIGDDAPAHATRQTQVNERRHVSPRAPHSLSESRHPHGVINHRSGRPPATRQSCEFLHARVRIRGQPRVTPHRNGNAHTHRAHGRRVNTLPGSARGQGLAGLLKGELQGWGGGGNNMDGGQDCAAAREHDARTRRARDVEADAVGGRGIEGEKLGGAASSGGVGTHRRHRSLIEEGRECAPQVCARGVECFAQLGACGRGFGQVSDDAVFQGWQGAAGGVVHVSPSRRFVVDVRSVRSDLVDTFYDTRHCLGCAEGALPRRRDVSAFPPPRRCVSRS